MWSTHDAKLKGPGGSKYKASIKEAYQVVCDPSDGISDIVQAAGLPRLGDAWQSTPQVRCVSMNPSQQSPVFWIVEIEYKGEFSRKAFDSTGKPEGSPLDQRPVIRWSKQDREVRITEDRFGVPMTTYNNEPYPDETMTISDIVATINRNYAGIDLAATHRYLHSVNSDNFLGFAPGTGRLTSFNADEKQNEDDGGYFEVTAEITFRYPWRTNPNYAWAKRVLHQGFLERRRFVVDVGPPDPNADFIVARAIDESGQETARPVLLDVDGKRLPDGVDPIYEEYEIYEPLSYNALGLLV